MYLFLALAFIIYGHCDAIAWSKGVGLIFLGCWFVLFAIRFEIFKNIDLHIKMFWITFCVALWLHEIYIIL